MNMNNRYTYKAKRKDNQEWIYGDLIHTKKLHFGKEDENILIISSIDDSTDYHEIIPETLCQCTGLKDIEGNYIFENDILTGNDYPFIDEGKQNYIGIVTFYDDMPGFQYEYKLVNKNKRGISDGINCEFEPDDNLKIDLKIIGNKFDEKVE